MKHASQEFGRYEEFCWVDYAPNGAKSRNKIVDYKKIEIPSEATDVFTSVCRFQDDFRDQASNSQTVKGCDNFLAYSDYLYLDVDDAKLENALGATRLHIRRFVDDFAVPLDAMKVYFSGKKGFHLLIPAELIGWEPSATLHNIMRSMAIEIAGNTLFDSKVYGKVQLFRVPGTIHSETKLYKIRIDPGDLISGLTVDEIKRRASVNEQWEPTENLEFEPSKNLHQLYLNCREKVEGQMGSKPVSAPPCILKLMKGSEEGERSEAGIRIASYFHAKGLPKNEAKVALTDWNSKCKPPLPLEELRAILDSAFSNTYGYSCNDSLLKSVCDKANCKKRLRWQERDETVEQVTTARLADGTAIEMLYDPDRNPSTFFAIYRENKVEYVDKTEDARRGKTLKPFDADPAVTKRLLFLADRATDFGTVDDLFIELRDFVRKYVSLPDDLVELVTLYAMSTWIYDSFRTVPYLHVTGAHGTGKSRLLAVLRPFCYKSIKASSSSSMAWIFRTLDRFLGTLILDEADFADSTNKSDIVKLLNLGYEVGGAVDRCSVKGEDFEPVSYSVFGPKICAGRFGWEEPSLESRCIGIEMDAVSDCTRFPTNLPVNFEEISLPLVGKLLMLRMVHRNHKFLEYDLYEITKEPRLKQIVQPLYGVARLLQPESGVLNRLDEFVKQQNQAMATLRIDSIEGLVLQSILILQSQVLKRVISLKEVTRGVNESAGNTGHNALSEKKIGSIVRNSLGLGTSRTNKGYVIQLDPTNERRLEQLGSRYQIQTGEAVKAKSASQSAPCSPNPTLVAAQGF